MKDEKNFIKIDGVKGKLYVPINNPKKKHPCDDCKSCNWCSDLRCNICICGKKEN